MIRDHAASAKAHLSYLDAEAVTLLEKAFGAAISPFETTKLSFNKLQQAFLMKLRRASCRDASLSNVGEPTFHQVGYHSVQMMCAS